MHTKIDNLIP